MPRRFRFAIASLLVSLVTFSVVGGCGGSSMHPGTGTAGAGTGTGGAAGGGNRGGLLGAGNSIGTGNTAGTGTGGSATGTAGTGTGTGGSGTGGAPMPTGALVFQGNAAALLNNGPPCTGEDGATGDRWCAFFTPLGTYPADLYVVNVTKAAAGTAIICGTSDANCLHLTDSFVQDDPMAATGIIHPSLFQGDTLVYYDATWTPFAWRPGMAGGRALAIADPTTMNVLLCQPSSKGSAVMCLRDLPMAMQTDPMNLILSDLLAGKVDDAADPPLVRVETVISASSADTTVGHFQFGFPVPGSDAIAWSARATRTGPEVLKMQTLGNDASRVTVASGVHGWNASPDGARWYWLSAFSDTNGVGTLQSAPYPAGASPVSLGANTFAYYFPTMPAASLLVLDSGKNLRVFADPVGAPTAAQSLDTGVIGVLGLSAQGHVAYAKISSGSGTSTLTNALVKKADGTGACTVTSAANSYLPAFFFSPDGGAASWIQATSSAVQAEYTRLADCTTTASDANANLAWAQPLGNRGLLFIDNFVSNTGALQTRAVAAGNMLSTDPLSMVSGQVGAFAAVASGGTDIVVYTVNGGGNDDGVYVRGFGP